MSSNPAQLIRTMMEATYPTFDDHAPVILDQREKLVNRARGWLKCGEIGDHELQEIVRLTAKTEMTVWRPLLYVIPVTESIEGRLETVPVPKRGSVGGEYVIRDLQRGEFHVITPHLVERYAS